MKGKKCCLKKEKVESLIIEKGRKFERMKNNLKPEWMNEIMKDMNEGNKWHMMERKKMGKKEWKKVKIKHMNEK